MVNNILNINAYYSSNKCETYVAFNEEKFEKEINSIKENKNYIKLTFHQYSNSAVVDMGKPESGSLLEIDSSLFNELENANKNLIIINSNHTQNYQPAKNLSNAILANKDNLSNFSYIVSRKIKDRRKAIKYILVNENKLDEKEAVRLIESAINHGKSNWANLINKSGIFKNIPKELNSVIGNHLNFEDIIITKQDRINAAAERTAEFIKLVNNQQIDNKEIKEFIADKDWTLLSSDQLDKVKYFIKKSGRTEIMQELDTSLKNWKKDGVTKASETFSR
jgi:hypothetical protein